MSYHSRDPLDIDHSELVETTDRIPQDQYRCLKSMFRVAEARRRIRLEEYTITSPENPEEMQERFCELSRRGIARVSYCTDTKRASVAWIEPASYYEGEGAAGLVFLREDVDLNTAETTGVYPFAAISWHAMVRLVERSDVSNLDHLDTAAAAALSWSHVAREAGCNGEYLVPHRDGIFCCVGLPQGIIDENGRAWANTLLKTWITEDEFALPLLRARTNLLAVTRAKSPFFPGFNDVEPWQRDAFAHMRAAGRAREYSRVKGYGMVNDERFAPWQAA
jgi:hypothetical protein